MEKPICYLIDDEHWAVNRLRGLLATLASEWEVTGFTSCREFFDAVGQEEPAILFLDVEMPVMTGFELLEKLHSDDIRPITVFVTAYEHYAIKAIKEQAFDYLLKPIDLEELKSTILRINSRLMSSSASERIDELEELTPAEKRVLQLLARGLTSREAGLKLNLSHHTINSHRNHILQKFGSKTLIEVLHRLGLK